MSELPKGWVATELGKIAQVVGGSTPKNSSDSSNFQQNGIPWITPSDLTGYTKTYISRGKRDLSQKGFISCGTKKLPKGSVLFSSRAPIGYCVIANNEVCTNQVFKSFVPFEGIIPEYLRYYLITSKNYIESVASGTTFKEISASRIATIPIPLSPLNEQGRIVAKLDRLFARSRCAREELGRVSGLVQRYKQAVLDSAISGKITQEWRAYQKLPEPEKVQLAEVVSDFSYGSSAKSHSFGIVPVLRMGNIQDGLLDWSNLVYTSDSLEIEKYRLREGDVLFNRTNSPELVGKTALYTGQYEAIYAGYLIRIRCSSRLLPAFLTYALNSPIGRYYCWQVKTDGVSQSNINAKKLGAFTFDLPCLEEQKEIVQRVEKLFKAIDLIEQEHQKASKLLDRLEQATLSKAFRGELVPQDPNDEPAAVLLERIQSDRQGQPKGKAIKSKQSHR